MMRTIKGLVLGLVLTLCISCFSAASHVRREIRSLSETERLRVFDAMIVMKKTSTGVGKRQYGSDFINYDDLVLKHFDASATKPCDQAHLGAAFLVYHRAFCLMFENSLVAIDSRIQGLPYWDYNMDSQRGADPRQSVVWSDTWFGSSSGDQSQGNAVLDGHFTRNGWRIKQNVAKTHGLSNPFDMLRAPFNNNPSPYVTRHDKACKTVTKINLKAWELCLKPPNFLTYYACIDPTIHTMAHSWLGGIWNTRISLPRPVCFVTYAVGVEKNWKNDCIVCPTNCTSPAEACECTVSDEFRCRLDRAILPIPTYGDFADVWTSPNDPIFFFHHANVDRHFMTWQALKKAEPANEFGGYPRASLPCKGHGLDDVIASENPFMSGLLRQNDNAGKEFPLTIFDVLNATTGANRKQFYSYV
jgi:hypothetical protein